MRQRKPVTSYISALVCLLVAGYFGTQVWNYYDDPFSTMVIYQYQADQSASVSGYVVRDEAVFPNQDSGVLDRTRGEGERVGTRGEVARVYSSQESLDNQATVADLKQLTQQLDYAITSSSNAANTLQLDQTIYQALLTYRQAVAANEIDDAIVQGAELRNLVVTQGFTQENSETLTALLSTAQSDYASAKRRISSANKIVTASTPGIYSAVVDGYETVLTLDNSSDFTPSTLNAISADATVSSNVGKLVLGDVWQYVVNVDAQVATQADYAGTVELSFLKSFDKTVTMDVVSVSPEENGQCTLVLECDRYLGELTLLRGQSANLIFNTMEGFRVPASALRVNEEGQTGIYCLVGIRARFKPVNVVYEGSDFLLVTAAAAAKLQDGEEVIIAAKDLFDGKVIE